MPPFLQVSFPGVGELVRNRAGRIELVFEQQLVEALELGLAPVSVLAGHVQNTTACVTWPSAVAALGREH